MEIKEFANVIIEEVGKKLENCEIEVKEVTKNNGVIYVAALVREKGSNIAPTIYLEPIYECYTHGHLDLTQCVEKVIDIYEQAKPDVKIDVDFFQKYQTVKPHLFAKLVNLAKNEERFKADGVVYWVVANDLALVPIVHFHNEVMGDGAITVVKDHVKTWKIDEDTLFADVRMALDSSKASVKSISDVIGHMMGGSAVVPGMDFMYVVTNQDGVNGAVNILNHASMDRLCDTMESDKLFIIPSSVHECIAIPYNENFLELGAMIKEVNATQLDESEILSDHPYIYDRTTGELTTYDED